MTLAGTAWNTYVLAGTREEAHGIRTLRLAPEAAARYTFVPGQFVTVRFPPGAGTDLEKQYTVTSTPEDPYLAITVKKTGVFSTALHAMRPGDRLELGEPYGYFALENDMRRVAFIAGGIGVAPFYAMLTGLPEATLTEKRLELFYSVKAEREAAFLGTFAALAAKLPDFNVTCAATREASEHPAFSYHERFTFEKLRDHLGEVADTYFFICGSIEFVDAFWEMLGERDVPETHIKTESFY